METPEFLHPLAAQNLNIETDMLERQRFWAVVLGLTVQQDGDRFCILWGENLQVGVSGFGKTPAEAIMAFERAMYEPANLNL